MRRIVAGVLAFALILVTPPQSAWAQFAEAARAVPAGEAPAAGQAGALRLGAAAFVPALGVSVLGAPALSALPAAALPFFAPGQRPFELTPPIRRAPVRPGAPVPALPPAAPAELPAVAPGAPAAPETAPSRPSEQGAAAPAPGEAAPDVRSELVAAGRALAAPDARPARTLEDLFTGAARRFGWDGAVAAPALAGASAAMSGLEPSAPRGAAVVPAVPDAASAPAAPRRSRLLGAAISFARVAAAAAATIGLNAAAVALAPALCAVVPVAAVWAVGAGFLLFPAALYARWRLAKRDSPRLAKVKALLDVALGVYAGALAVAAPSLAVVLTGAGLVQAALPAAGLAAGLAARGAPFLNSVLVWGALGLAPLAVGAAAAAVGGLAVAPLLGMLALPAATTIAFFLGSLISSAESGRPFAVPGSIQKMRFPSFPWVMIGVTFALLAGYAAVHASLAFLAWNLLGLRAPTKWDKSQPLWKNVFNKAANFDVLYLGLLALTATTGFASPLTFLVLAFSGERAAVWTERLLARFLPRAAPAPSTASAPAAEAPADDAVVRWPSFHSWGKTFGILASMAGLGVLLGASVFGFHSLLGAAVPAILLAAVPFWFAARIIKFVMHDKPADAKADPEFFAVMSGLREKINAKRRLLGKKEIPMPELVNDPLPLPNAYATGRGPFHALVGVTAGLKEMTLDPENVREGVARLVANSNPGTKAFKVFRLAISGSISGVTAASSPADIQAAVLKADRVELKALGVRMLSGVLGHEFSHVMDRHLLSGAVAGAVSSSIAFASYGVMWGVSRVQARGKKLYDRLFGRGTPAAGPAALDAGEEDGGASRELVDPISIGVAAKSLPALLKLFAALWAPALVQIVQMASSRNNEAMADEDGALLSEDPQSLALALGLLTTWRPKPGFVLPASTLPRAAALSFLMTVNPLEQARQANALPALDPVTNAVVGKADDFLFDLFVTHPDTAVRIDKLSDMADALRAAAPTRPPVLAPADAPAAAKSGLFRRVWEKIKGVYRVLPDESRNRAFWVFTLGQGLATLGADFHYTALPNLVAPTKADTAKLGYNRAVNWGSQAASSLATGPLVDRQPVKRTLVWTYVGRAALMALVPILFATGHFGFAVFSLLIGAAGFMQATAGTAGSVAFNRILGDDEAFYNRANAVETIVTNVVGVVGPLLAGAFIAWAGSFFAAALMGSALSYGVYAVILLMTGVGYGMYLRLPRDEMLSARRGLLAQLKTLNLGGTTVKGVSAGKLPDGRAGLFVEVAGDPASATGLPAEFSGYPVRAAAYRNPVRELIDGFRLSFKDRFLRLYLVLSTLSFAAGDSLVFAAMPRYIADVLKAGPGAFGLFLAASSLGLGIASGAMAFVKDPAQAALSPVAKEFRAALAARDPELDAGRLDRAAQAVRGSLSEVLDRYKGEWQAGRGRARAPGELAADVLAEAAPALSKTLEITPAAAAALLEASGAARDVRLWAARRGRAYVEGSRRDAKSGMDSLQRQGKWSNLLHAASWLAYAGAFFMHALWPSVALILLSAVLSGPANIVWSSLTTRVVAGSFPNDQGKVYSAMTFYMLAASVIGVLGFGWLLATVPTATALLIVGGVLAACTVFDLIQTFVIFPLKRP